MPKSTLSTEQIRQQIFDLMMANDGIAGQLKDANCFHITLKPGCKPNWDAVWINQSVSPEVQAAFEAAKLEVQQIANLQLPALGMGTFQ